MAEIDNQQVKSKKDLFLEKQKAKYPDLNTEDEESLYGQINDDYDDYDKRLGETKKNEEALSGLFSSDPKSASFLMNWKNGENPVVQLIREYGDEFRDALDDPDKQEEFAKAHSEYLEKLANNKKLQEEAQNNLAEMLANLDAAQQEGGFSEDQADNAYELLAKILDDGILNKVSKETWTMIFKALNHDEDVVSAAHEAEVRGRNAKIDKDKKKTTVPDNLPPMVGGGGTAPKKEKRDLGALDRFANPSDDIWQRGKKR